MIFELDKESKVKLYHQLYQKFVDLIQSGELKQGDKYPSIRVLAQDNSFGRNTITKAYEELENAGYLYSMPKSGCFVKLPGDPVPTADEHAAFHANIPTVESVMENAAAQNETSVSFIKNSSSKDIVNQNMDADSVVVPATFVMDSPFDMVKEDSPDGFASELGTDLQEKSDLLITSSGDSIARHDEEKEKVYNSPEELFLDSIKNAIIEQSNILLKGTDYKELQGIPTLRVAIATFLYQFHGININPANIIVGTDLAQLLTNILSLKEFRHPKENSRGLLALAENHLKEIDVVEPSIAFVEHNHKRMHEVCRNIKFKVKDVMADEYGMTPSSLITSSATVAFTSTADIADSDSMSVERLDELLEWAGVTDYRYIIHYDIKTSPHKEMAPKNVETLQKKLIYISSFKHLLAKSIKAAFVVLPPKLVESYNKKFAYFECPMSLLDQCALSDILIKGKLIKYLNNLEQI